MQTGAEVVVDSSVLVAALVDAGVSGEWAESVVSQGSLHAPELVRVEVANVLRRLERTRVITGNEALAAYEDFMQLDLNLYAFEPFADRIWELRHNATGFDAWYVALAEALDVPMATLDTKLVEATGPQCQFLTPGPWQVNEPAS